MERSKHGMIDLIVSKLNVAELSQGTQLIRLRLFTGTLPVNKELFTGTPATVGLPVR